MSLPIVVIHKHDSHYLPYCLAQAKSSNPKSDIVLIGDKNNNHYKFINHRNMYEYFNEAKEFGKIYKHLSTNMPVAEKFCFQRWFILNSFMAANNIAKCVHIDSDVMLYVDVTEEQKKFEQFDFTLSSGGSAHCSFFNSKQALEKFCAFVISLYTEPFLFSLLESRYQERISNNRSGGASDMTAFEKFRERHPPNKIGETTVIIGASTYDDNVNCSDGFEILHGLKRICWVNGQPFCKHIKSNEKIRFNSLHFQGGAKKYMRKYYNGKEFRLNYELYHSLVQSKIKKIERYITRLRK